MNKEINIGCSSYNNLEWKNIFYPENISSSKWFEYYCNFFNTYEMNGTFYKAPTLKIMQNWFLKTPEHFLFSVKAPKEITHNKKFIGCEELLKDLYNICGNGLKHKLGCILFQFPPSYDYSHEKLLFIIDQLDLEFNNVIEFRHPSWWIPEVWNELSKNNITFCSVSHPQLPEKILNGFPLVYIRLHGRDKMFYSEYTVNELKNITDKILESKKTKNAFVYFNNTASSAGIVNALEMKKIISQNQQLI